MDSSILDLHPSFSEVLGIDSQVISVLTLESSQNSDLKLLLSSVSKYIFSKVDTENDYKKFEENAKQKEIDQEHELHAIGLKIHSKEKEITELKDINLKLTEEVKTLKNKNSSSPSDNFDDFQNSTSQSNNLEHKKTEIISQENERLQSSIDLLNLKNRELQASCEREQEQLKESRIKGSNLENSVMSLEAELTTHQNQIVYLKQQVSIFESICATFEKEFEEHVKIHGSRFNDQCSQTLDLKNTLANSESKCHSTLCSLDYYRSLYEKILLENSQLQEKYHDSLQKEILLEQRLQSENESLNQLVAFYRESADKSSHKVSSLEEENVNLKAQYQSLLETSANFELESNNEISQLKEEYNMLLEENEQFRSLPIPSYSNQDGSEGFEDSTSLKLELLKLKRENRNLQHSLKEIVANVKRRMPLIEEQKCQYDILFEKNKKLAVDLAKKEVESDEILYKFNEARSREDKLRLMSISLENTVNNLSSQVHVLLTQNEFLKKNASLNENTNSEILLDHEAMSLNSRGVIDTILTPFQDIKELQQQNQNLLFVTQELSERLEAEEVKLKIKIDDLEKALTGDTKSLFGKMNDQIFNLDEKIISLESELTICHRILKNNLGSKSDAGNSGVDTEQNGNLAELQMLVAKLEDELIRAKDSHSKKIIDLDNKNKENLTSLSLKNIQIAKLETSLATSEERLKVKETICKGHLDELDKTHAQCKSHEEQLLSMTKKQNDLIFENERINLLKEQISLRIQAITTERDGLNSTNEQLRQEITRSIQNEGKLKIIVEDLETRINKESFKRHDIPENDILVMELQSERKLLKEKLQLLYNDQATMITRHDRITSAQNSKVIQLNEQVLSLKAELNSVTTGLSQSCGQISELENEIKQLKSNPDVLPTPAVSENDYPELMDKLDDSRKEVSELSQMLSNKVAENQADKAALLNLTEVYAKFKEHADLQLKNYSLDIEKLSKNRALLECEVENLNTKISELNTELLSSRSHIQRIESMHKVELQEISASLMKCNTSNESLMKQVDLLKADLELATNNYEQELTSHADKLSVLNDYRSEILGLKNENHVLKQQLYSSKAKESEAVSTLHKLRCTHGKHISELNNRLSDMEALKDNVSSQLECEKSVDFSSVDLSELVKCEGTSSELFEFLKKNKDDLQTKLDTLTSVNHHLNAEVATLTKSLDQARQAIKIEKSRCRELHSNIINEKNVSVSLLRESNAFLRAERDNLESKAIQLQSELSSSLAQLNPLVDTVRELTSELEMYKNETKSLKESNAEWMERVQTMLHQTEKIDPEEFSKLQNETQDLKHKLSTAESELSSIQASHNKEKTGFQDAIKELNEKNLRLRQTGLHFKRLYEDSKADNRSRLPREQQTNLSNLQSEVQTLRAQHENILKINSSLEAKAQKLASLRAALNLPESEEEDESAIKKFIESQAKVELLEKNNASLTEKLGKYVKGYTVCKKALNDAKEELEKLKLSLVDLETQLQSKSDEIKTLRESTTSLEAENTTSSESIKQLEGKHHQELNKLKEENIKTVQELNDAHLVQINQMEMRFKAQLSKPTKEIERLKNELSTLKDEPLPQSLDVPKSPLSTTDSKPPPPLKKTLSASSGTKRGYELSTDKPAEEDPNETSLASKKAKKTEIDDIIADDLNTTNILDIPAGGFEEPDDPDDLLLSNDDQVD